jgi:hypothetical protein
MENLKSIMKTAMEVHGNVVRLLMNMCQNDEFTK